MYDRPILTGSACAPNKSVDANAASPPATSLPQQVWVDPADRKCRSNELTRNSKTTAIHIPRDDLALLQRVAVERAIRVGGRPSVSDVLRVLIEKHRAELEVEANRSKHSRSAVPANGGCSSPRS
jgi:hypothetical protein